MPRHAAPIAARCQAEPPSSDATLQSSELGMSGELAKGEQVQGQGEQGEQGMAGELTIDLLAALRADFFKSEKNRLALNVCSRCCGLPSQQA